jgi:membrane-bound ClpP family serine protease
MSDVDPLVWSALLMLLGSALVVLEIFVPSGGILGFLATASLVSAIGLAFYHYGPGAGLAFLGVAVISLPILVALGFKYWPKTPMGRRFLLGLPTRDEVSPDDERQQMLKQLVGKRGTAKTRMLPSGAVHVDGRTIDAVSQGMAIEPGQAVVVVEVKANRVVVRPADDHPSLGRGQVDDVLSQPLDALGLDQLDEPLA